MPDVRYWIGFNRVIGIGPAKVRALIDHFGDLDTAWQAEPYDLKEAGLDLGKTESPVTPVFMKCPLSQVTQMIYDLRENHGVFCSVVIYPVVPKDVVMLRLIPTADHTLEDVAYTIKAFKAIKSKIDNNEYPHEMADFNK